MVKSECVRHYFQKVRGKWRCCYCGVPRGKAQIALQVRRPAP